jgi:DinB superfamily
VNDTHPVVATIVNLYHDVHRQLREEIIDLVPEALEWTPGPGTNSIGTLIVHLLGSEVEMLRSVLGLPNDRDRNAELVAQTSQRDDLLHRIDTADTDLERLGMSITEHDLFTSRVRPNKSAAQSGLFWLVRNYGHAREHLAHVQLTRQLYLLTSTR